MNKTNNDNKIFLRFSKNIEYDHLNINLFNECIHDVHLCQQISEISNGSCSAYQDFSFDCWCEVSKTIDQCSSDGGFIDYLGGALCTLMCRPTDLYWIYVVYIFWLLWWCLSLAFTADTFFVPVVQWIAAILGMNETLGKRLEINEENLE